MYAIIEAGGKQYRVSEGDLIDVERRSGEVGQAIDFQEVLLIGDQETIHVGKPVLAGARVVGTIAEQGKKAKIIVFKFKRRKKYRKKQGHRQLFTRVRIDQIELDGQKPKAEKTQQAITKAKEVTGAVAKAPAKTVKKKAAKKAPATAKDKAVKTSAKTSKKAAPKAATKKKTKSVKKTAKKSTKKTVTKKN
ncbi:MAG: 50S ribosomal protein L21 [Acidobacteria bacterium]|nr:MAG: 50S ribosomal protein L21 [Acidobacteriota bacterium]